MSEISQDELIEIEEREAIAVENLPPDVAQPAWEYRVEKAKREKEQNDRHKTH